MKPPVEAPGRYGTGTSRVTVSYRQNVKQAQYKLVKITIVTITCNSEEHLEQTIRSVIEQTYGNVEYIIVDGASTDHTTDIIESYDEHLGSWVSEPDEGIADAMNKGLALATGDYILFLHSDDYLVSPDVLQMSTSYLDEKHDIFVFNIQYGQPDCYEVRRSRGFNAWLNFKTGLYHQGVICRRSVFEKIGVFDPQFDIAMDYDWFLRAYRAGLSVKKCPCTLSVMRDTGISSRVDRHSLKKRFAEEKRVHYKNCTSASMRLGYFLYWRLYPWYRRIRYAVGV